MQGFILLGFQKFVCERLGAELWRTAQSDAGVVDRVYLPLQSYPGEDLKGLVASVSRMTGMSTSLVLESFGDALASEILQLHGGLLDPKWRVLDVLAHSEEIVDRMRLSSGEMSADPSPLAGHWGRDGEVILTYHSPLKLCSMLKGIVRGLGANMEQPVLFEELRCMLAGASACELAVRLERTQTSERPQASRRRLTPPPISMSTVRSVLLGERADLPSSPPSAPPSSRGESSGWRTSAPKKEPGTIPPASGVVSTRFPPPSSIPSVAPPQSSPSEPPKRADELLDAERRR